MRRLNNFILYLNFILEYNFKIQIFQFKYFAYSPFCEKNHVKASFNVVRFLRYVPKHYIGTHEKYKFSWCFHGYIAAITKRQLLHGRKS